MSEEEKKAIKRIKSYKELFDKGYCKDCNELCVLDNFPNKDLSIKIETILNLIEKQAKENKELKEKELDYMTVYMTGIYDERNKWKQAIFKKKELEKEMRRNRFKYGNDNPISTGAYNKQYTEIDMNEYAGMEANRVLQELLNEEE